MGSPRGPKSQGLCKSGEECGLDPKSQRVLGQGCDRMTTIRWEALSRSGWQDRLEEGTGAGREALHIAHGGFVNFTYET